MFTSALVLKLFQEIIVSSASSIESNDEVTAMHMSLSNNAFKGLKAHLWGEKSNSELTWVVSSNQLPFNQTDHQNNRVMKWSHFSQQELTGLYQKQLCDTTFPDGTRSKWISSSSNLKWESNKGTIPSLISVKLQVSLSQFLVQAGPFITNLKQVSPAPSAQHQHHLVLQLTKKLHFQI